jgi:hypothetical protein
LLGERHERTRWQPHVQQPVTVRADAGPLQHFEL